MKKQVIVLFLFSVLIGGCSPYTLLDSKVLNNADLSAYHTFQIVSPQNGELPQGMSMIDYYNTANAIKQQMLIRGYEENTNGQLLINIGIYVKDNIETKDAIPPSSRPYYMGPRTSYLRNYYSDAKVITNINKEGILTIDIIDKKDNLYLYTASVGDIVNPGDHKVKDMEQLTLAVSALFKNFPVAPK